MLNQLLNEWSARTGKSRADAAQTLGVSYGSLGYWSRGARAPSARQCHALAKMLGCDPVELLHSFSAGPTAAETRSTCADNVASAGGDDSDAALAEPADISGGAA